ncbi:GntR family transcriptional regulator [Terracoccus luteus]|uniref:GntR family transcriptional regulator n=1 Tax=Terracoccus luteus TaxID=53356 RepID=A0A839PS75_9MICO|nr:GntR family transcriptional regulator [Terracoccus luteus]MBB2986377.1 GntR family transcriptional regulator [Terracoccus luteus]MCP2172033.1 GntR family transcriptional regulator [Terracoccus luteus]
MEAPVDVVIDRASPVPLYHQLAEQLTAAVVSGRLEPGDPFENELAMADRLGLSRPTVRRAIQELVAQGLLLRRRGLGTTVAQRQIHRRVGLTSLYDDLRAQGDTEPTTTVLHHAVVENEVAARALDLPPGTPLLEIGRLRRAGSTPLALLRNWLPPAYSDLTAADLEQDGLYALLRARGARPVVAHQRIGARSPTTAERRHLGLRGSQPVLTMTRSAFDAQGSPVEYGDHSYRAQDYAIEVMLDER